MTHIIASMAQNNRINREVSGLNMERIYKTMRNAGAGSIAMGIVIATAGLTVGIISIVTGAILLKRKSEIEF